MLMKREIVILCDEAKMNGIIKDTVSLFKYLGNYFNEDRSLQDEVRFIVGESVESFCEWFQEQ